MRERHIHAILIPMQQTVAIVPLTARFYIEIVAQRGDHISVSVSRKFSLAINISDDDERRVDSITVVFGKNGGGKTQLLLDVCNSFARQQGTRPLGILWEEDDQLLFDPGSHLRRLQFQGNVQVAKRGIFEAGEAFGAAFYTTSPFEAARRRLALADGDTLDVTPSFSADNPFGGIPLLLAASALPADLEFIQTMSVQPKLKIPSLRSLVETYTSEKRRRGLPSEPLFGQVTNDQRMTLKHLPEELRKPLCDVLAIEMHRARLEGSEAAATFFSQLRDALPGLSPVTTSRDILQKSISDFLDRRAGRASISSDQIYSALKYASETGQMRLKRKGTFIDHIRDARAWPNNVVEGLQAAESLGMLRWSFLKLSSGQIAMLMLFASLAGAFEDLARKQKRNVVLTVDEGEMFMHPEWQRTFLAQLVKFLAFYRPRFDSIHLIVSTHSLIVAGDAPPNRLFDVVSGQMRNGFAAPPDELLKTVYNVPDFAGEMAEQLYDRIGDYLRHGGTLEEAEQVHALVEQIASPRLRTYLRDEVGRRMELGRAQA